MYLIRNYLNYISCPVQRDWATHVPVNWQTHVFNTWVDGYPP